jgi:hypothetical protein
MAYYSRPEEVAQRFEDIFNANKELLGFATVAFNLENLIVEYPAIDLTMPNILRQVHGTKKFFVVFEMSFWIYHANYEQTHAQRSMEDLVLATNVVRFLHQSHIRRLEDPADPGPNKNKLIDSWVASEIGGRVARQDRSGIITTRLIWQGQTEVNYQDS